MKADISIWDLIHTSLELREAFLRVFQVAHISPTIEPAALDSMMSMIAVPQFISFSSDELPPVGINHNLPLSANKHDFLICNSTNLDDASTMADSAAVAISSNRHVHARC